MNLQFKASAQVLKEELNISFQNYQSSVAENASNSPSLYLEKTAPNKVVVTNSDCTWLLENNNKFHFTESISLENLSLDR